MAPDFWDVLIFGGENLPFPCYLRKKSYPKLLTLLGSSPVHNPLFSRTVADGHTTSPSLGSSIRINELTLIFFTTIAPSSPPKLAHVNPGSIPVLKKNHRRLKLKQTTAKNSVLVPRKLAEICFFGRREADVSHLH